MTDPKVRLAEIRERWAKATAGPWRVGDDYGKSHWRGRVMADDPNAIMPGTRLVAHCYYPGGEGESAEAIAAAPDDIAWLISEVERLSTAEQDAYSAFLDGQQRIAALEAGL